MDLLKEIKEIATSISKDIDLINKSKLDILTKIEKDEDENKLLIQGKIDLIKFTIYFLAVGSERLKLLCLNLLDDQIKGKGI